MTKVTKRQVSTDALETLGTIIDDTQKRDAIHLAVFPVEAAHNLQPGDDVAVINGVATSKKGKKVGIVDPFLKEPVLRGERFWLVLYPRMVTSLRHVWSHPDFADDTDQTAIPATSVKSSEVVEAEKYLDVIANGASLTRNALIDGAREYKEYGEYMIQGGKWESFSVGEESWAAYDIVTGETTSENKRNNFFSCSC